MVALRSTIKVYLVAHIKVKAHDDANSYTRRLLLD